MTLILTINERESIWLLADRRLSSQGRVVKDDARKILFLETQDGVAILGYAGLGATAAGTEPADWMSAVLRGRNTTLEQSLDILAEAIKREYPRHMVSLPGPTGPAHHVLITAFLGNEMWQYTIDLAIESDRTNTKFRFTRWTMRKTPTMMVDRTPPLGVAGSGGHYLSQDRKWTRPLLSLVKAYNRGRVSARAVAEHLACLNNKVYLGISDKSVGPRCIVAWRNRKDGIHQGGGGHQFYTGRTRESSTSMVPTISRGTDLNAFYGVMAPPMFRNLQNMMNLHIQPMLADEPPNDPVWENIDLGLLDDLPDKPDENLR